MAMQVVEHAAPRITVLDARELDKAIFRILQSQTNVAAKYLPAWVLNKYGLELETLLKILIWKLSIGKQRATFGQQLLHLKYNSDSKYENILTLAFLTIGLPYLKEKLQSSQLFEIGESRMVFKLLETAESLLKILNLLTFIRFLVRGGSSSFLECLFRVRPVSTVAQSKRNVGYSYMTRELIWHGFIELLVNLLPVVNFRRAKRSLVRLLYGSPRRVVQSSRSGGQQPAFTSSHLCQLCKESPILPHRIGCSHVFCYVCLASEKESDKWFECPGCGHCDPEPDSIQPVQSDLLSQPTPLDTAT